MNIRGPRGRAASGRRGFTLIELLVTIAIIGILAALVAGAVARGKQSSRRLACANNLRQVNLAIRFYSDDSNDNLPTLPDPNPYPNGVGAFYKELIKSYLGLSGPLSTNGDVFICPADAWLHTDFFHAFTSYTFNGYEAGPGSIPRITGQKLAALPQPAKAVVVGEWTAFFGGSWHPLKPGDYPDAKNQLAFADGHVNWEKIYWDGVPGSEPRSYEPPAGYQYSWDGHP